MTTEELINKAKEIYGNKYTYNKIKFVDYDTNFVVCCPEHGDFEKDYNHFIVRKRGCNDCKMKEVFSRLREKNKEKFLRRAKEKYGDKYSYNLNEYTDSKTPITITCPKHGSYSMTPDRHLNKKYGCRECAKESIISAFSMTKDEFIKRARKKYGDKYDYSLVDYKNMRTKVKIICPVHGLFEQAPAKHLEGECNRCAKEKMWAKNPRRITTEKFIERAKKRHGNRYDYSLSRCDACFDIVKIICPVHGAFEQIAKEHYRGRGCPKCSESHGERIISMFFNSTNIKYIPQYYFDGLKFKSFLKYDFYLPDYNILLEYNGIQHYTPTDFSGKLTKEETWQLFLKERHCEWLKRKYAIKNGYNYFVIKYDENIEKKLTEYLASAKVA